MAWDSPSVTSSAISINAHAPTEKMKMGMSRSISCLRNFLVMLRSNSHGFMMTGDGYYHMRRSGVQVKPFGWLFRGVMRPRPGKGRWKPKVRVFWWAAWVKMRLRVWAASSRLLSQPIFQVGFWNMRRWLWARSTVWRSSSLVSWQRMR